MVHRGMVYMIEGDVILLTQTALRDLGVIPREFPLIGQFGVIIQTDDGIDRLEATKFGVKYIPPVKEEKIIAMDQIPMQANTAVKLVSDGSDQQISV